MVTMNDELAQKKSSVDAAASDYVTSLTVLGVGFMIQLRKDIKGIDGHLSGILSFIVFHRFNMQSKIGLSKAVDSGSGYPLRQVKMKTKGMSY
jgi:hypothetical protein